MTTGRAAAVVDPGDAGRAARRRDWALASWRRTHVGHDLNTPPDAATVHRLATALNGCFETFSADAGTFADDAFFDLLPPFWRFQLQGPAAFLAQLRTIARGPTTPASCAWSPRRAASSWSTRRSRPTRRPAAFCCAKCATAASPRSSSTATVSGIRAAGPARRRGADAASGAGDAVDDRAGPGACPDRDGRPGAGRRPEARPDDRGARGRGRGGPASATRPAARARRCRLSPDPAPPATRGAWAPTCSPRCGCSRPWPRPTGPWAGRR